MGYYSAIKKQELAISTIPTWKISKQVEWKKPEKRERVHNVYDSIYMTF